MLPSSFKLYSAVVLFRFRSNLKSLRAISYQRPRYFSFSKGLNAVAPLGMVAHEKNPVIRAAVRSELNKLVVFIVVHFDPILSYYDSSIVHQIISLLSFLFP